MKNSVTFRIKKTHVLFLFILIMVFIGINMLSNAYKLYVESLPEPLDDIENIELIQLEAPPENALTAVISTTKGDITAVLYEAEAPNAVRIFKNAAESGLYSGLDVGLYEQGSVFTLDVPEPAETYAAELHKNLWTFKGALCMTEDEDIIFINTAKFSDEDREYLSAEGELADVRGAFLEHGGVPDYSRKYAVFGQVIEGTDVLETIAASPTNSVITVTGVRILSEDRDE